jgi:hypothetical protein
MYSIFKLFVVMDAELLAVGILWALQQVPLEQTVDYDTRGARCQRATMFLVERCQLSLGLSCILDRLRMPH